MAEATQFDNSQREQIPDKVLMYACIFTYESHRERKQMLDYQVNINAI